MSYKRIPQREAQRLRKRVEELEGVIEGQRRRWAQEYIGGTQIGATSYLADGAVPVAIRTARSLKHAVVAVGDESGMIRFIALPLPKEP